MTDLERFFRQIARNLAATDPARLHRPLPLNDLRDSIVPYRANRRSLQLESSEDYELVLLRLCAGEGGFARTEPDDVQAEFEAEARSSNPDLKIVHRHEKAVVSLDPRLLALALDHQPGLAFAPPDHVPRSSLSEEAPATEAEPPSAEPPGGGGDAASGSGTQECGLCGHELPGGRLVKFCPHCGASQGLSRCTACQSKVEAGWRHCINCGSELPSIP